MKKQKHQEQEQEQEESEQKFEYSQPSKPDAVQIAKPKSLDIPMHRTFIKHVERALLNNPHYPHTATR